MRLLIFSTDSYFKHLQIFCTACSLTSASESDNNNVNVWIKLLSVISFPNESAKEAKFLAKASLTFHDLSSPAAKRVPNVWI